VKCAVGTKCNANPTIPIPLHPCTTSPRVSGAQRIADSDIAYGTARSGILRNQSAADSGWLFFASGGGGLGLARGCNARRLIRVHSLEASSRATARWEQPYRMQCGCRVVSAKSPTPPNARWDYRGATSYTAWQPA
jgi:hypothetical protein